MLGFFDESEFEILGSKYPTRYLLQEMKVCLMPPLTYQFSFHMQDQVAERESSSRTLWSNT